MASAAQSAFGGPGGPGDPFGQRAVDTSAAGFVSGAVGGLRASHLRPADALRHID